jgi:hypothetical protein
MSTQEVLRFLGISRGSLYNLYIRPGRLTPLRNPALRRPPLEFERAAVYALRPDKAPHLDAAPPRLLAEEPPGYDPRG